MPLTFRVLTHDDLAGKTLDGLRRLFDREYLAEYGEWNPDQPYGYAPADTHVVAVDQGEVLGHVGFQRRSISVGDQDVVVAGTGGVLVEQRARRAGLGRLLMHRAQQAMRRLDAVEFGYLGCRPAVVSFYEAAGWHRVQASERHQDRRDPSKTVVSDASPILICASHANIANWPAGEIDLRGLPW